MFPTGNVAGDDSAGADERVGTDPDAGEDDSTGADAGTVFDDRRTSVVGGVARAGVFIVGERYVGSDENVAANDAVGGKEDTLGDSSILSDLRPAADFAV